MTFSRVKEILTEAVSGWTDRVGRDPNFLKKHGPNFPPIDKDFSKADLLSGQARGLSLISPELIGVGKANETNLVSVLRAGLPAPANVDQMPPDGPMMSEDKIKEIEEWIDAGCPD